MHSRCTFKMKSIHVLSLFLAALPGLCWSMGRMTWFEAQETCRKKNQSLTLSTNISSRFYWTGVYKRTSHWIKILGCYNASSLQFKNEIKFSVASPPLCQEYCLQNSLLDFSVQGKTCVCLSSGFEDSKRLHSSNCTYACEEGLLMSSECGGESAVNVFSTDTSILKIKSHCLSLQCGGDSKLVDTKCESALPTICSDRKIVPPSVNPNYPTCTTENVKWRCGMDRCKSNGVYLFGKMNLTDISSACRSYINTPRWIGVVKEIYITIDQGKIITESEKMFHNACQQCRNGENGIDCRFIECTSKSNSDAQCSEVLQFNTTLPEIKAKITTIPERTTRGIYPQTESTDSTATLFETSGRSTQLPHKNTEYLDTSARTVLGDQDSDGSAIRTVIPLVVVIVILGCCAVAGVIYLRRRKNKQEKVKNVGRALTMDDENYTNIESHSVQNNLIIQHSNPEYQLADNLILASESPYNETEDGTYDHLGDKKARKRPVEGIYNHASSTELPDLSVYDLANQKRLSDEDNDYDHAGVANSKYGQYNAPQIGESNYSDLS